MRNATTLLLLISATSYAIACVAVLVFTMRHRDTPLFGLQLSLVAGLGLGSVLRLMMFLGLPGVPWAGALNAAAAVTLTMFVLRSHAPLRIMADNYERTVELLHSNEIAHVQAVSVAHLRAVEEFANAIPTLAWMARADGYIDWYNRQWYEYTGSTPDAMEGWGWTAVHDPQTLPAVLVRWKDSIARGVPFEMTFPLKGRAGEYRQFLTRVVPALDETGAVVRWYGTNTDVHESLRASATLDLLAGRGTT